MPEVRLLEGRFQTQTYRNCLTWKLIAMEFFFFPAFGMFPTTSANKALQYDGLGFRKYRKAGGEFLMNWILPLALLFSGRRGGE